MADGTLAHNNIERRTIRAIALRLVPFLMLCYFFNLLDRSNIRIASLQLRPQLGLSAAAYGLGGSLFFVGYFMFEVPSSLLLEKFGARRWIARIMISWGPHLGIDRLCDRPGPFSIMRFILGMAEAGFTPGVYLFFTL